MNHLGIDADRNYTMTCKIKTSKAHWLDGKSKQNESALVFLIPDESTETDFFLGKYLPSVANTNVEMTADAARPINRRIKLALCRESKEHPSGFYLHVMDVEAVDVLKKMVGKKLSIRVISENEESRIVIR